MKALTLSALLSTLLWTACSRRPEPSRLPAGLKLSVSSGEGQNAPTGAWLDQPVTLQLNDANGALANVRLHLASRPRMSFDPADPVTDSSGQATINMRMGEEAGTYDIHVEWNGVPLAPVFHERALSPQAAHGRLIAQQHCSRCHSPESTPEQVSNYDNLDPKPHLLEDGTTTNGFSPTELEQIIAHGGPALGKSPLMPAYGGTLSRSQTADVVAYIRAVAEPPYREEVSHANPQ